MPHIHVEYSGNLDGAVDMWALCEALRTAAAGIEAFPLAGIRVRAIRADYFAIADGSREHGFVDIAVRLRGGRPLEVRKDASARIFSAAREFLAPYLAEHSIALSLEMRDIDPELSPKTGTIRNFLKV